MHITSEALTDSLRAAGLRLTTSRRAVCEVFAEHHDKHLTAASITARIGGSVDQSTVYRILDALEDAGLVTHTHLGHGASVYHLAGDEPHQHIVCEVCGSAAEIDVAHFEDALRAIRTETGYVVEPSHFALTGRCIDCVEPFEG